MNLEEAVKLSNQLSQEDLLTFMEVVAHRLDVYVGLVGNRCVTGEVESVCLNGPAVQINLDCDLSDLAGGE